MSKKILNYVAPPAMAITSGATTPNPGIAGISVWSTTEQKMVTWNGTSWASGGVVLGSTAAVDIAIASDPGVATTAARSDHAHSHGSLSNGSLHALATGSLHGFMSATDFTKLAGIATGATATPLASVAPQALGAAAAIGSSVQAAKADHVHAHGAQPLGDGTNHAVVSGSVAGFMSSADYTKLAGISPGAGSTPLSLVAPPAIQLIGAVGTSSSVARGDHVHAHGTQTDGGLHGLATGSLNGFMAPAQFTKLAGIAAGATATILSTTTPNAVGTTAVVGSGTSASKYDHVHAHGSQTDATLHAVATGSANGFMSAADFTKLAGIAAGAIAPAWATAAPPALSLTATGVVGVSTNIAREDHTHAHGSQTIGTHHAAATASVNGFMTAAQYTKLTAIPSLVSSSVGVADAGKLPLLDATGKYSTTFFSTGAADVQVNTATFPDQTEALNTDTGGIRLFVENVAERRFLAIAPANSAPIQFLQPFMNSNIAVWSCAGTGNSGFIDATTGTVAYYPPAGCAITTAAVASSMSSLRNTWGVSRTTGFHYIVRFKLSTAVSRWFAGVSSAAPTAADPSTQLVNLLGVGQDLSDSLISAISTTATAAQQVKTNLTGWPTPTVNVYSYELHVFANPNDINNVYYTLRRVDVNPNLIISGSWTTNLPAAGTVLIPIIWECTATGVAQTMLIFSQYFETF